MQNRILNDLPRSNNSLEAWHQALSNDINSHPGINKLIHHFIKEQHLTECCNEQIRSGTEFERDTREVKRDNLIKDLYSEYNVKEMLLNFWTN